MSYIIITRSVPPCAYCDKAKREVNNEGFRYRVIDIAGNETAKELFKAMGYTNVPLIIDPQGVIIGGYDDLVKYLNPRNPAVVSDAMPDYIAY